MGRPGGLGIPAAEGWLALRPLVLRRVLRGAAPATAVTAAAGWLAVNVAIEVLAWVDEDISSFVVAVMMGENGGLTPW